jgi:hypothetical protein
VKPSGPTTIRGGHVEKFTINLSNVDAAGAAAKIALQHSKIINPLAASR